MPPQAPDLSLELPVPQVWELPGLLQIPPARRGGMGGSRGVAGVSTMFTLGESRGPETHLPGCFGKGLVQIALVCLERLWGLY